MIKIYDFMFIKVEWYFTCLVRRQQVFRHHVFYVVLIRHFSWLNNKILDFLDHKYEKFIFQMDKKS